MKSRREPVKEGDVFYPNPTNFFARHSHRRVVGIVGARVFYSVGGDRNHSCKASSLMKWGRRGGRA